MMHRRAGYGGRRPRDCWLSAWLVALEVIYGQLLDAVTLGIIFARIAHPKNRARTVFISDCAVVARRDGALEVHVPCGRRAPDAGALKPLTRVLSMSQT